MMKSLLFNLSRAIGHVLAAVITFSTIGFMVVVGLFMLTPPGWIAWPFVGIYAIGFQRRLNRRRTALVLSHVRQAMRLSLPLPEFLAAAARSEPARSGQQLTDVAAALSLGAHVSHAIHAGAPQLTDREATLLLSAERAGSLDAALVTIDNQRRRLDASDNAQPGAIIGYPFMLLMAMGLMVTGIMILIIPKFEKIFDDFGTELPRLTKALINTARWMGGRLYPDQIVPGMIFVVLAMFVGIFLFLAAQWQVTRRLIAPLLWQLPLIGDGERSGAMADACHTIALWLRAGAALDRAFKEASGLAINPVLTGKLGHCADLLAQGTPFSDALRQARLPTRAAGMLASAHATGSLTEAFDFLARHYDNRSHRFITFVRAAVTPVLLIALAALETFIVVGLFLPLVKLISSLT